MTMKNNRCTHRGSTEASDGPIQPVGHGHLPRLSADELNNSNKGERIEPDVKEIRHRWRRRRGAPDRLDGENDITNSPGREGQAEEYRNIATRAIDECPRNAQSTCDQLDPTNDPAVEPCPIRVASRRINETR